MSCTHKGCVHPRLKTTGLIQENSNAIMKEEVFSSLRLLRCKFQKVCVEGFSAFAVCSFICFMLLLCKTEHK